MAVVQDITTVERVRSCGTHARRIEGVGFVVNGASKDRSVTVNGILRCGSATACPECAPKIAQHRADEVTEALTRHAANEGGVLFTTLTMGHVSPELPLQRFLDVVMDCWHRVQQRKAWKTLRAMGLGHVRVVEVTHSMNGWHPHIHLLSFVAGAHLEDAQALMALVLDDWRDLVRKYGSGFRTAKAAQDTQSVDMSSFSVDRLGIYVTKQGAGWSIADELTKGQEKQARGKGMTPQQMLAHFAATGDDEYRRLWIEWERVAHGRRLFEWSRGLREALGMDVEVEDEDLVNRDADVEAESFGMSGQDFNRKVDRRSLDELRSLAKTADFEAEDVAQHFARWMDAYDVHLYFGADWHQRRRDGERHREEARQLKAAQTTVRARIVRLMNRRER